MELKVKVQNYDWGKIGFNSQVAKLFKSANADVVINNIPYAELWMGTHVNAPSKVKQTDELLSNVIKQHPQYLGSKSIEKFGNDLPFLFKVLSVNRALSIQAHPTKQHAEHLHKTWPDLYKDPNHKPELAIALSDFKAMCGFRPFLEIKTFLKNVPEFREVVGDENAQSFIDSNENDLDLLKICFKNMMNRPQTTLQQILVKLINRIKDNWLSNDFKEVDDLVVNLNEQFPGDVGCFGPYFFNVLNLKPGEALYLGPNVPHAYLLGDCIECMACSDNVVRGGLTPKHIDTETLCDMLDYTGIPSKEIVFQPIKENDFTLAFRPPVEDFAVCSLKLESSQPKTLIKKAVASILICIEGKGSAGTLEVSPGKVFFIPADTEFKFTAVSSNMLLFQGFANL